MRRAELNDITIFVEVVRANGFRAAADKLKLGAGSVSEAVQRFEDRLGVRLIERTTRAISLTKAGEVLYRRSMPAIGEIESALADVHSMGGALTGKLRLNAPLGTGHLFLDRMIADFANEYPLLIVEVIYDEKKVDLVTGGYDAAIRAETLLDPETHAIAVGPEHDMMVVASPSYLENRAAPVVPQDIAKHPGICFAFGSSEKLAPWVFKCKDGNVTVEPTARVVTNSVGSILDYAETGLGLAYVFEASVRPRLESGKLVQVLPGFPTALPRFSLNYLSKRNMPARLRAFIDFTKYSNRA